MVWFQILKINTVLHSVLRWLNGKGFFLFILDEKAIFFKIYYFLSIASQPQFPLTSPPSPHSTLDPLTLLHFQKKQQASRG